MSKVSVWKALEIDGESKRKKNDAQEEKQMSDITEFIYNISMLWMAIVYSLYRAI